MRKPIATCIEGGRPPCPICPVVQTCPHGHRVVGKSRKTERTLYGRACKTTPTENRLDLLKRIGKQIGGL